MLVIAKTGYYKIEVDTRKNRAYLELKGFWKSADVAPDYLEDWEKAFRFLEPNFTIVTNLIDLKTLPKDAIELHEAGHKLVVKNGLFQVAEVIGDSFFVEFQIKNLVDKTQMPSNQFRNKHEAEQWLDEQLKIFHNKAG